MDPFLCSPVVATKLSLQYGLRLRPANYPRSRSVVAQSVAHGMTYYAGCPNRNSLSHLRPDNLLGDWEILDAQEPPITQFVLAEYACRMVFVGLGVADRQYYCHYAESHGRDYDVWNCVPVGQGELDLLREGLLTPRELLDKPGPKFLLVSFTVADEELFVNVEAFRPESLPRVGASLVCVPPGGDE
jgi:hypothetical protein